MKKIRGRGLMLIGVLMAALAAGGMLVVLSGPANTPPPPPKAKVVVAAGPLTLGSQLTEASVKLAEIEAITAPKGSFISLADVIGRVIRVDASAGQTLYESDFAAGGTASGSELVKALAPGKRAIAVQVDQVTGVGTIIQPGDHVDVIVGIDAGNFPVVQPAPNSTGGAATVQAVTGLNATSVKMLVQNIEVLGTLLPPPDPTAASKPAATDSPTGTKDAGTHLSGQQEIVLLAVTPNQAEVIKFAQMQGNISLVLRSAGDNAAAPEVTNGVVLKTLIDKYGVLVPGQITVK